jgi:LCP family protein required for cell wall assembly
MKDIDSIHKNQPLEPNQSGNFGGQNRPAGQTVKPQSVNLLKQSGKSNGKKTLKRILWCVALIIVILGGIILVRAANLSNKIFVGQKTTFFGQIINFIRGSSDNQTLIGEDLGQINVLLLGVGGAGHDGPYLTDTMILAQIRPDIGEITLTSIPRDYYTTLPDKTSQKINAAFALGLGQNMDWNQAGNWARQTAGNVSGLQIPYFAVMDFSGFEQAIDKVGGVDVTVDRTFTDYQYPDSGTGYLPPQTFIAGPQHMNGATALIFARSRHAAGPEGSDFARSQRQQKIIDAFKQKVLSQNLIGSAATINNLLGIFADHFHTNMSPAEMNELYGLVKNKNMNILSLSLDPSTNLICQEILASDGAYVLTPCPDKSEQDVQNFFKNSFSAAKLKAENATVWLASSTGDKAAYNTALRELNDAGVTVYQLNYSKDNLSQTTVYQVNSKPATAEFIANTLNATAVNLPPPGVTVDKNKVDVIIVLGQNAGILPSPPLYVPPPARTSTSATDTIDTITSTSTATSTKQ